MAKPSPYFPTQDIPSYQEWAKGNDKIGSSHSPSFTQASDVIINAGYASSGAVAITTAGTFAPWPDYGFVENQDSAEIMFYSSKTGTGQLNIATSSARGLDGTSAAAGLNGHTVRLLIPNVQGRIINQMLAEITALHNIRKVNAVASTPRTVTAAESFQTFTNEGGGAQIIFNLPTAAAGLRYKFVVQDADGLRIVASAGDTIRLGAGSANVSSVAGYIESLTIGDSVELLAINATEWMAISTPNGSWGIA